MKNKLLLTNEFAYSKPEVVYTIRHTRYGVGVDVEVRSSLPYSLNYCIPPSKYGYWIRSQEELVLKGANDRTD